MTVICCHTSFLLRFKDYGILLNIYILYILKGVVYKFFCKELTCLKLNKLLFS